MFKSGLWHEELTLFQWVTLLKSPLSLLFSFWVLCNYKLLCSIVSSVSIDLSHETIEGVPHIHASLCTDLKIPKVSWSRIFHCHVVGHFSVWQIALIPKKHYDDPWVCVVRELLEPAFQSVETLSWSAIENEECTDCLAKEKGSQSFELLLAQSVPDVQLCPLVSGMLHLYHLLRDLYSACALLLFIEHVINETVCDTSFADTSMPH